MANELTADEARELKKSTTAALRKIFKKHVGRDRGSIAEVENENYQVRKGDAEVAGLGLSGPRLSASCSDCNGATSSLARTAGVRYSSVGR